MSDHIDGPRTTADPAADLTDLYAFTSPSDPARTVLIANVFPSAGETALFSNVVDYSLVMRRARVAGMGDAASFKIEGPEFRFTFKFEVLQPGTGAGRPRQTGICRLPDGRNLPIVVGDERGASTPDGSARSFAGLRSDPFFIGWAPGRPQPLANLLQEDNVLCIVVEFDTATFLSPGTQPLFGVIAETTLRDTSPQQLIPPPPRFDWVGRPEQTNFRLNGVAGATDLRDLWNQETPFAPTHALAPVFRERLTQSLKLWDARDGKIDWEDSALAANVNVFLNDFLLLDVAKPTSDTSHLEIEKSTVAGHAYKTGGGRTVNANVIDILVTWLVNRDRGPFLHSATRATQLAMSRFPYVAPPNTLPLTITRSVDLAAPPREVWAVVGQFDGPWLLRVATMQTTGAGIGQLRRIDTVDGKVIVERLTGLDDGQMRLSYALVRGIPAANYEGSIEVRPKATGSTVTWTVDYRPEGTANGVVQAIISGLQRANLDSLVVRFGALW